MSNLYRSRKSGIQTLKFTDGFGEKRQLSLGKIPDRDAQIIQTHIDSLIVSQSCGTPITVEVSLWLNRIPAALYEKLAAKNLVEPKAPIEFSTLESFMANYIGSRQDLSHNSLHLLKYTRDKLLTYFKPRFKGFGETNDYRRLNTGHADEFRQWLVNQKYSEATIAGVITICRQYWRILLRKKLVEHNIFEDVPTGKFYNKSRLFYIDQPMFNQMILATKSDLEIQTLVALCRLGGLRNRSETFNLRWSDIDFDTKMMKVPQPKTAKKTGNPWRLVPLFDSLSPFLQKLFEFQNVGIDIPSNSYVIQFHRIKPESLNQKFRRLLKQGGVAKYPRLWHQMRSSRQVELSMNIPLSQVCDFLGNSIRVAEQNYLHTPVDMYREATKY